MKILVVKIHLSLLSHVDNTKTDFSFFVNGKNLPKTPKMGYTKLQTLTAFPVRMRKEVLFVENNNFE